jgi:hypothetical protein
MKKVLLQRGEIVQVAPNPDNPVFDYALMVVTEPQPWGAKGYILCPGQEGQAYLRLNFEDMEQTGGHAHWMVS